MWRTIERIRQKPKATRERLALSVAALATILIFGVWLSTWYGRLSDKDKDSKTQVATVVESDSPLTTIKNIFSQGIGQVIEQVGLLQETVSDNLTAIEEYKQASSSLDSMPALVSPTTTTNTTTATTTATTSKPR